MVFDPVPDGNPFYYPGTSVLKNKLGIVDQNMLRQAEQIITSLNQSTLPPVELTTQGLKAVHKHLYDELYEWAGEFRSIDAVLHNTHNGTTLTLPADDLVPAFDTVFAAIPTNRDPTDTLGLARSASAVIGTFAAAVPFPAHNHVTMTAFVGKWFDDAGHNIDFGSWTRLEWEHVVRPILDDNNLQPVVQNIIDHTRLLKPEELRQTVLYWGETSQRLHNLLDLYHRLAGRLFQALDSNTATLETRNDHLLDSIGALDAKSDQLVEDFNNLMSRLRDDAYTRGSIAWRSSPGSAPTSVPERNQLIALGLSRQHHDLWGTSLLSPQPGTEATYETVKVLHQRFAEQQIMTISQDPPTQSRPGPGH